MNNAKVIETLNQIMERELSGVVRYTHYSLMVFGHNRIPIVKWLREQADESLSHATRAGELVTTLGGHPSLRLAPLLETHKHAINDILQESLEHENESLQLYKALLEQTDGKSVMIEEYAREMICDEEDHISEVQKMLRAPGA
ncbi:MAG: bacterioferritin [Bdellovibrionales bacterium]